MTAAREFIAFNGRLTKEEYDAVRHAYSKRYSSPHLPAILWNHDPFSTLNFVHALKLAVGWERLTITKNVWLPAGAAGKRRLHRKGEVVIVNPSDARMLKHTGRVEIPEPFLNFEI